MGPWVMQRLRQTQPHHPAQISLPILFPWILFPSKRTIFCDLRLRPDRPRNHHAHYNRSFGRNGDKPKRDHGNRVCEVVEHVVVLDRARKSSTRIRAVGPNDFRFASSYRATGDTSGQPIRHHRSQLPLALYLLSFAPPFRSQSDANWRDTMPHPYVLYAIGLLAAILAGAISPAVNFASGYWFTGMLEKDATPDELIGRGAQVAWIFAAIAILMFFST